MQQFTNKMLPKIQCALVGSVLVLMVLVGSTGAAPEPKNFLFEDADIEMTTEFVTEPGTNVEYVLMDDTGNNDLNGGDDTLIAQPSEPAESIVASASSTTSSTSNSIGGNSGKQTGSNHQANLLLLQQLQEQLRRQQILQAKLQLPAASTAQQQSVQQQQPQFSLDALVKSFVKVFQVAKTQIDKGARTVRDILQFFDRKKYTSILPQATETNLVLT